MKKSGALLIFLSLFLLVLPFIASAIEYPFGGLKGDQITPCDYIKALFVWGLGIVGALAVTAIAYGGAHYMMGKVEEGKEIMYSALLGLLLLFGSWLILYTINPDLATLKCEPLPPASSVTSPSPSPTPSPTPGTQGDQQVRDELTSHNISVNKSCVQGSSDSTCLNGLQQNTISGVENIQQNCGCSLTITGGTEPGHSESGTYSHTNGYKLDLRPGTVDNYVQQQGCGKAPQDTNCKGADGNTYRYETAGGAHWDVCFKC